MPNIILTYTILYSIKSNPFNSGIIGAICGLVIDISGNYIIGFNALIVMYMAVIINCISNKYYYDNIFICSALVFIYSLIFSAIKIVVVAIFQNTIPFWYIFMRFVFLECLYNMIISFLLYFIVKWINNEYIRGI